MRGGMDKLDALFSEVREFHRTFGHAAPDAPVMMTPEQVEQRLGFIDEENRELREATTLIDQVDAVIDRLYFTIGELVMMGVWPQRIWDTVHEANMSKVWPDGSVRLREGDNKVIKPPEWRPPEPMIAAEVARQVRRAAMKARPVDPENKAA